jgi:hypothetical protein
MWPWYCERSFERAVFRIVDSGWGIRLLNLGPAAPNPELRAHDRKGLGHLEWHLLGGRRNMDREEQLVLDIEAVTEGSSGG